MTKSAKQNKQNKQSAAPEQEQVHLADQVKSYVEEALKKYGQHYEHLHDTVEDVSDSLIKTTKRKPLLTLGIAVACGIVIGKIFK